MKNLLINVDGLYKKEEKGMTVSLNKNSLVELFNPIYTKVKNIQFPINRPIDIFTSFMDNNYSYITEFDHNNEKIAVICTEPICNISVYRKHITISGSDQNVLCELEQDGFSLLRELLTFYKDSINGVESFGQSIFSIFSYDSIRLFEKKISNTIQKDTLPDIWAIIPRITIMMNLTTKKASVIVNEQKKSISDQKLDELLLRYSNSLYGQKKPDVTKKNSSQNCTKSQNEVNYTKSEFCEIVNKAKEYIKAGDIFQIVLSLESKQKTNLTAEEIYNRMNKVNKNTNNFLIRSPEFELIGSSPEIMVNKIKDQCIIRPLAGTVPSNGKKDIEQEKKLLESEKDCAEHRMLVDLARNDLGRVCKYSTIRPLELMKAGYYFKVIHIVSEIIGEIHPEKDAFDLMKSCFPAGTMTGTPKIRAMQIIDELENTPRGFYSGCFGFFTAANELISYITIRCLTLINNTAYARAGAGIIYDSIPENEYYECFNKLKNALLALEEEL